MLLLYCIKVEIDKGAYIKNECSAVTKLNTKNNAEIIADKKQAYCM